MKPRCQDRNRHWVGSKAKRAAQLKRPLPVRVGPFMLTLEGLLVVPGRDELAEQHTPQSIPLLLTHSQSASYSLKHRAIPYEGYLHRRQQTLRFVSGGRSFKPED